MQIELNKRIVAARDAESILAIVEAEHGAFNAVNAATACNRLAKTRQGSLRGLRIDDRRVQTLLSTVTRVAADLGGQLLLDPTGGPHWRLVSSRSALVRSFPPFVHQVSLGPRCGCAGTCRKIVVEFQRGRSPLADGATRHVGCVLSDELLEALFQSAEMGVKRRGRLQS
jgi:hypothetical protein